MPLISLLAVKIAYNDTFPTAVTLRGRGAKNVKVPQTYYSSIADKDEFIVPVLTAGAILFSGGRQWRLVGAYAGTKAQKASQSVLDRGGVISGSSAGASTQGNLLARGNTANY